MDANTSRRALIGGAGLAAVIAVAPAIAVTAHATPTAFSIAKANHDRALARFNGLSDALEDTDPAAFAREEALHSHAHDALDESTPNNWPELVALMEHMLGNGSHPGAKGCSALIAHAKRLAKREG